MTEKQYSYNGRWRSIIFILLFFGLCSVVLASEAATNQRGMLLEGIIPLGQTGATLMLWGLTGCAALFVLLALALAVRRVVSPRTLVLDAKGLFLPHGFLQRQQSRIDFSEILSVYEWKHSGQTLLKLEIRLKTYSITESLLESRSSYEELKSLLLSAVPGARLQV